MRWGRAHLHPQDTPEGRGLSWVRTWAQGHTSDKRDKSLGTGTRWKRKKFIEHNSILSSTRYTKVTQASKAWRI